jgi:hypothetical protein
MIPVRQTMPGLETVIPIYQMTPVLQTTLVRRMILALWTILIYSIIPALRTMSGHQMVLVPQIIPAPRTTLGHRMTGDLQTTREVGAEAVKAAERTSEQDWLVGFYSRFTTDPDTTI